MTCRFQQHLFRLAITLSLGCAFVSSTMAQTILYTEDFESIDLGPNVDEGLIDDDAREEVWSQTGPDGWVVDRSGVPGFGTDADGVVEFAGWTFMDPIWWAETAGDQERSNFALEAGFVTAVADGDEWDDAFRAPGEMNTFLSTPSIPVGGPNEAFEFLTSWRPDGTQTATVTASYDGGDPVELLRWESEGASEFFQEDLNPEPISIVPDVPAGAENVVFSFGYTRAQNHWWWAVDDISYGNFSEDFEDLILGPNIEEGRAVPAENVWSKDGPEGWNIEDEVPGQDEDNDFNGVTEWIGWSFADKNWWIGAAGDQRRSEFTNAEGTVAVADPDEWDDAEHPDSATEGWYNTFMETGEISLEGVEAGTVKLKFDSSWRPEFDDDYQQTGSLSVKFDDGPSQELFLWESDPASDDFKDDNSTNETIEVDIDNPEGASKMTLTFGLFDAGNDWWWAIDNIEVSAAGGGGITGDYNGNGLLDAGDLDLQASEGIANNDLSYDLNNDGVVNTADRSVWVNDVKNTWMGDANLNGQFDSADLVTVFSAAKYETLEAATWNQGDWNGDGQFDSGDLVEAFSNAGYNAGEQPGGPNPATAAVPEPASIMTLLIGMLGIGLARRRRGT
ncbi:MAG: PEP-CTERM sorting domain-containing protein [Pirellulaceae bacterium]|nr:PEP-CTERM sorting domain-containing protein [Pirellulaceae bacterium]